MDRASSLSHAAIPHTSSPKASKTVRSWGKSCCVHQVLAVFDPSLGHRITQIADAVVRILTERRDREARRKDGGERPGRYALGYADGGPCMKMSGSYALRLSMINTSLTISLGLSLHA